MRSRDRQRGLRGQGVGGGVGARGCLEEQGVRHYGRIEGVFGWRENKGGGFSQESFMSEENE